MQMGQTALHIAALWGSYAVAEKLLDMGADVNVENSRWGNMVRPPR